MISRTNEAWLRHLQNDGPGQQAALHDLRLALLRGLRRAFAGSPRIFDAFLEDAVQDSLLRVLDRLPQFQGRSRFVTWATAIAIRTAMSELRRRRWKDVSFDELTAEGRSPDAWSHPRLGLEAELLPEQRALVTKMYEVMRRDLTQRQRTALLAELEGMPQVEVARHLGSNPNALYKLTHDARKRLRRGLEAAGYGGDDVRAAFST